MRPDWVEGIGQVWGWEVKKTKPPIAIVPPSLSDEGLQHKMVAAARRLRTLVNNQYEVTVKRDFSIEPNGKEVWVFIISISTPDPLGPFAVSCSLEVAEAEIHASVMRRQLERSAALEEAKKTAASMGYKLVKDTADTQVRPTTEEVS